MDIYEIKCEIHRIFEDVIDVTIPKDTSDFEMGDDDNWDSFAHMNLVLAIEQFFSISFSDSDIENSISYDEIANIVSSKL